ncbi:MAG TPA: nucleoside hydrolase, partial [Anaerolineales bacterium]|nr:nucleoside hydrolase [Anaerolineales bacterium]
MHRLANKKRLLLVILFLLCIAGSTYLITRIQNNRNTINPATSPSIANILKDNQTVPQIILDTDFAGDVDDVGALAILQAYADNGQVDILGVMISSGNHYAPRAVDAINTYYGRPDIPIGITWSPSVSIQSRYTLDIALDFPNDIDVIPNAIDLYREILASKPDKSVIIVSVGFLTNLQGLLSSKPDENSTLNGIDLVSAKVAYLVTMGGYYPNSKDHPDKKEYNFALDPAATNYVVTNWPTPIFFSGYEIGEDIITGTSLDETAPDNPVRVAYKLYTGGRGRSSWDLTAVHFAVGNNKNVWQLIGPGINQTLPNGANYWKEIADGQHYYLRNVFSKS